VKVENNNERKAQNISYTMIISVVFIAVIVLVNFFVRSLEGEYRRVDISGTDVYALTDTTKDFLKTLDKEVTIYTIAETGGEDEVIETVIGRYLTCSSKIKHEMVNPIEDPQFVSKYQANLSQGSLMVVCGDKYMPVERGDMMYTVSTTADSARVMIDVEGLITAAIAKVSSDYTPKAYVMIGTDRMGIETEIITAIERQNIEMDTFRFSETGALPEDADVIVLFSPTADITEEEYTALSEFMDNGGRLMYMQYFSTADAIDYSNIEELLSRYGVTLPAGNVIEGDSSYYSDGEKPYQIYPVLQPHKITQSLIDNNQRVMYIISNRIQVDKVPEHVTVDTLLKTSHSAYLKDPDDSTMIKLPTDIGGVFDLAVAIADSKTNAKAVVFASYAIAYAEIDDAVNGNNSDLLVNAFAWLTDQDQIVAIDARKYGMSKLLLTQKFKDKFLMGAVIVVPAAIIGVGLVGWIRRRKR